MQTGNVRKKVRKKNVAIKRCEKCINFVPSFDTVFLYYNKLHLFLQHKSLLSTVYVIILLISGVAEMAKMKNNNRIISTFLH